MRILGLIFAFLVLGVSAFAQDRSNVLNDMSARETQIDRVATEILDDKTDLIAARDLLRSLQKQSQEQTEPFRQKLEQVTSDLDRLGDAPAEGMPPEAQSIAEERQRLLKELSDLNGIIRQSDLNMAEAERLLEEIARLRRDQFSESIFGRNETILSPDIWQDTMSAFKTEADNFGQALSQWWDDKISQQQGWETFLSIGTAIVLMLACFVPVRRQLRLFITKRLRGVEPYGSRKVLVLAAYTIARMLPALLGGWIFYQTLLSVGIIPESAQALVQSIWFGFVVLIVVDAAAAGVIAPYAPKWRVLNLSDPHAILVRLMAFLVAFCIISEHILIEAISLAGDTDVSLVLLKSVTTFILAIVLYVLCRSKIWEIEEQSSSTSANDIWPRIRFIGKAIAIVSVIATLIGFSNLGHYLTRSTFLLIALAAVIWVVRSIFRELVRFFDGRFTNPDAAKNEHDSLMFYWIGFGIDVVSFLLFIPPALLLLGAQWVDVRDGVGDALIGIKIGGFNFSILKIMAAIGFFLLLLSLTRLIQRTAETRVFPKSRMDIGVQNSLKTLIGYAGLIVAFLVAVSAVGFNLSNLAIIAGALSIGIGFGLQSIVSNFVSGLILLFERPIKVGDWIVTSSGEGFVKKISVRSTEIETFDRASVIVPNSELISGAVTNWTHKDQIGRMTIAVGVSYSADPDEVIALLEEVAKEHPHILDYPEPFIYFADFADSSLNFELRGYVADVKSGLKIRTELRVAIFKKLKEAGIEIPFPQRDVNLKSSS